MSIDVFGFFSRLKNTKKNNEALTKRLMADTVEVSLLVREDTAREHNGLKVYDWIMDIAEGWTHLCHMGYTVKSINVINDTFLTLVLYLRLIVAVEYELTNDGTITITTYLPKYDGKTPRKSSKVVKLGDRLYLVTGDGYIHPWRRDVIYICGRINCANQVDVDLNEIIDVFNQ